MIDEEPQPEEKTIALDAHVAKLKKLAECSDNIKFWKKEYEKAQQAVAEIMGDATLGTVDGQKAITFRYEDRFRGSDFKAAYPDTYRTFVTEVTEKKFNVDWFRSARPDLYEEFKVRSMKNTFEV